MFHHRHQTVYQARHISPNDSSTQSCSSHLTCMRPYDADREDAIGFIDLRAGTLKHNTSSLPMMMFQSYSRPASGIKSLLVKSCTAVQHGCSWRSHSRTRRIALVHRECVETKHQMSNGSRPKSRHRTAGIQYQSGRAVVALATIQTSPYLRPDESA